MNSPWRYSEMILAGGNAGDDLGLVFLTHVTEELDRLVARHDRAGHGVIAFRDLLHALLDFRQVFLGEAALEGEIVVKAVFNDRPDGHLRLGEQFLHRLRQQVRRGVADHLDPLRALVGDDRDRGVLLDQERGIDQLVVDAPGERGAREAGADARGNLGDRYGFGIFTAAAVRQRDDWHKRPFRQWRPLRMAA